ncbi:hypothetical protein AB4238_19920 [Shewanella sp. 10N.286.45.A1]|uniref:hypothetical protein n=1 Tax=Shewanella sp. 10N.286.45.A1 TaxID=3229694 RepID=UPI00354CA264
MDVLIPDRRDPLKVAKEGICTWQYLCLFAVIRQGERKKGFVHGSTYPSSFSHWMQFHYNYLIDVLFIKPLKISHISIILLNPFALLFVVNLYL